MKTGHNKKPKRCIDPVMKYCQGCKYGVIVYPESVETKEDLEGCCFDTFYMFNLEDTKPTKLEEWRVKRWFRCIDRKRKRELKHRNKYYID